MDNNFTDLPLGLGMALMMNERTKQGYESLSETEKEHIILRCKDAKSKTEMDKIINSISSEDGLRDLLKGPSIG
ncbi:MAG: hypothetical protein K2H52_04535 [Lachnospiraceae bacterium]|nr:hypothetical protein [Lachnospiraceae bacterium]MDE7287479.1 hypothetical protein [Lachnospiraceae bacterium]